MPRTSSPVTWVGGKASLLRHLLPLVNPAPGEVSYVEPFGGSGVVLINKQPHLSECYNDTDGDLVNLFRVIRDPDAVCHLWWELLNTQVSRREFREAIGHASMGPEPAYIRAARFVVRCRQRFGGGMPGKAKDTERSWGTTRTSSRGVNAQVSRWLRPLQDFPAIHRRLATVVVDDQDAVRCVRQWDTPATLFYVDPPYVGTEGYYKGGFDDGSHRQLAKALNAVRGRVVLSYYACGLVDELYPAKKWRRKSVSTIATTCGYGPSTDGPSKVRDCQRRVELILTNFRPKSRKRL